MAFLQEYIDDPYIQVVILFEGGVLLSGEAIWGKTFEKKIINPSDMLLEVLEVAEDEPYYNPSDIYPFYHQSFFLLESLEEAAIIQQRVRQVPQISRVMVPYGEEKVDVYGEKYWTWLEGRGNIDGRDINQILERMRVLKNPILVVERAD